jgi:hypothetical protein
MKAKGIHTPITAFAPAESPLGPGPGEDGEGMPVAGGVELVDEELAILVGADELRDEVVSGAAESAAENAAKSELCHQIGIPLPNMLYNSGPIAVVLTLPWA